MSVDDSGSRACRSLSLAIVSRDGGRDRDGEYGLFIDGELGRAASGEIRELIEPATGEPLARAASPARPTSTARSTPRAPRWTAPGARRPPTERSRLLHALADAMVANRKELAELEVRNVGKAISSVKAELDQAVENFRFYASAIGVDRAAARTRSAARCSSTR